MKKIGIMGGTFNPIHNGHLMMAKCAQEEYQLDEVLFIPAGQPPHKQVYGRVENEHRRNMVQLAISNHPGFVLEEMELKSREPSYSYKTLEELSRRYLDVRLYFILGEDSLQSFSHWVHPEIICQYATILVAHRPSEDEKKVQSSDEMIVRTMEQYRKKFQGDFQMISMPEIPISSSEIREQINTGESYEAMVPQVVAAYIKEHRLYQESHIEVSFKELQQEMEHILKPSRYQHTIGVMYTAASLAMRYEYSMEDAMIAGVLHDCAKCISDEERLAICKEKDIPVKEIERQYPHLLHSKVGALFAEEKYQITNPDILHAIQVHTTGCPEMNLLDKIIFTADYIEPNRDQAPRLMEIRHMAFHDLDQAVLMILEDTVHYLTHGESEIDETTMLTYEYYKRRL